VAGEREAGREPEVDVVVLAYGEEQWLDQCLAAILTSEGVRVRVLLVDNGSPAAVEVAGRDARITLISPDRNTGYAGGCVLAAAAGESAVIAFVNSDAVVEPSALRHLVDGLDDDTIGLVTGCVLLPGTPDRINAAGNPVHWLGHSWAGGYGDPVHHHQRRRRVASASGALCALRRERWTQLGGFDSIYFAYHEDVDLSWRVWCSGRQVVYLPQARCRHYYDFSRHPGKLELLERNRLITVLTVYQASTLCRLLPMLLLTELGTLLLAMLNGWGEAKVRGWCWLLRNGGHLRHRRSWVNALRTVPDQDWLWRLDNSLELPAEAPGKPPALARAVLAGYWRMVRPRPIRHCPDQAPGSALGFPDGG
jgi:GT2 family glycosyltransferase